MTRYIWTTSVANEAALLKDAALSKGDIRGPKSWPTLPDPEDDLRAWGVLGTAEDPPGTGAALDTSDPKGQPMSIELDAMKTGISGLCACTVHESGRGLAPCLGHATRIREHQAMYAALHAISQGTDKDPGEYASETLDAIHYWHEDHPMPMLAELRPTQRDT